MAAPQVSEGGRAFDAPRRGPPVAASQRLPKLPCVMRRDGPPALVIWRKHSVIPMPVLPRWRHEIREPVEELERRQLDDAVGPRPRGHPRTAPADPVGRFVPWQHVADSGCAAGGARDRGESLDLGKNDFREGRDGRRAIGKHAPQPLGHGDHPLAHGHRRDDVIDEMGGGLRHVPAVARRTDASSLAGERHDNPLGTGTETGAGSDALAFGEAGQREKREIVRDAPPAGSPWRYVDRAWVR